MQDGLLTASKPELLEGGDDQRFRALLHDYFAFGRALDETRAKFASLINLSPSQYLILIAIAHSTQAEPIGISQLATQLHLSGAFVTNEVNKLVSDGLVEKTTHPSDGRRVQLSVTVEGVSQLTKLAVFQRPMNDALFGMLTSEEFRVLARLLARLAANGDYALRLAGHVEATITLEKSGVPDLQPAKAKRSRKV